MKKDSRRTHVRVAIVLLLIINTIITTTYKANASQKVQTNNSTNVIDPAIAIAATQINTKNALIQSSKNINDEQKKQKMSVEAYHVDAAKQLVKIHNHLIKLYRKSDGGALLDNHSHINDILKSERIASGNFKYIIKSLGATHDGNPYNAFMNSYVTIKDSVLKDIFPNQTSVTHKEIFDEYVKLEEKIAYGTATKEERNKINALSRGLNYNLSKFISLNNDCLTISSTNKLEMAANDEYEHIQLSQKALIANIGKIENEYNHRNNNNNLIKISNQNTKNKTLSQNNEN